MRITCDQFRHQIDSFLDGDSTIEESSEIKHHLQSCHNCCLEFKSYDKSVKLMRKIFNDTDPPDSLRKKVFEKCGCLDPRDTNCCPPKNNK
jgi:predicted anti-sigma-YlaC factor YlaD